MALHNDLGRIGENTAAEYLIRQGYVIRERNWRCFKYELDIVAEKDGCIVFVEVKTRSTTFVSPLDAINYKKKMNLVRAGMAYMKHNGLKNELRFDFITLVGTEDNFEIEHIPDAIAPPKKFY